MVVGFTTTDKISAYHHWSSEFEPGSGEVYSIQHYVIKFVSDLKQVGVFLGVLPFPPSIKPDCHNIAEILLKVTLNTISLAWKILHFWFPWQYNKTYLYSWTNNKVKSDICIYLIVVKLYRNLIVIIVICILVSTILTGEVCILFVSTKLWIPNWWKLQKKA